MTRPYRVALNIGHCRCAPLDVDQFQPVTAAAAAAETGVSGGDDTETVTEGEEEVSAVMEVNDETGAFEYTLYSLTAPPYIRLYVPGRPMMLFHVNSNKLFLRKL